MIAATAVLLISGLVHGIWTERWQTSHALQQACARLADVSPTAGAWKSSPVEVDPEPFQQARAAAYWMRLYRKEGVSNPITVILMCGRADHMSVHTPDICYRGAGYDMVGEQVKATVALPPSPQSLSPAGRGVGGEGSASAELWTARFRQGSKAAGHELRIYWTWSSGGSWQAPTSPRWTFGAEPFLYKLYVAHDNTGFAGHDGITDDFLRQLLPVLETALLAGRHKEDACR